MRTPEKPSTVRYAAQTLDALRTDEQQALLLARAAVRVWEEWSRMGENGEPDGVMGQDQKLDDAIRHLYQQTRETDVFYSGRRTSPHSPGGTDDE